MGLWGALLPIGYNKALPYGVTLNKPEGSSFTSADAQDGAGGRMPLFMA